MKKIILAIIIATSLVSCNDKKQQNMKPETTEVESDNKNYSLIGKHGSITYPMFKAEVDYLTDTTIHWRVKDDKGELHEATENITYNKLSDHQYFLNWIEKDGMTISQIIDTKSGEVKAFASNSDEKSDRGGRSGFLLEGKITFSEK